MRLRKTALFDTRLRSIKDPRARARNNVAVQRMQDDNFGDSKPVGSGVVEARIHYGPGYRVYYTRLGDELVVLLRCGDSPRRRRTLPGPSRSRQHSEAADRRSS